MKSDRQYLQHIYESTSSILIYTKEMNKENFLVNQLVSDAVLRNFRIISEATKRISPETKLHYQEVSWTNLVEVGDNVLDNYYSVDLNQIWRVISDILPLQREGIKSIITSFS